MASCSLTTTVTAIDDEQVSLRASSPLLSPETQSRFMRDEVCFAVDDQDAIIGTLSKYAAHRVASDTNRAPLHRAFSVFLLRVDNGKLLVQQRSAQKITFPLLWANSCCSHPIAGLDEADVVDGIAKAARRKLQHELGIPISLVRPHCARVT